MMKLKTKSAKIIHILQIKLKNVILEVIEADIYYVNLGHWKTPISAAVVIEVSNCTENIDQEHNCQ
jgi:hypothetical protein